MKILVICQNYPSNEDNTPMSFVHTRNREYMTHYPSIDISVLSFSNKKQYSYEGINVYTENDINLSSFDLVLSHAPNIRNHFRFLFKHYGSLKKVIFFIHGHEVLIKKNYYPAPYDSSLKSTLKSIVSHFYDLIKVKLLSHIYKKLINDKKCHIVFVSEWIRNAFLESIAFPKKLLISNCSIINNSIHKAFIENTYRAKDTPIKNFITIRSFDNPKYAIDEVIRIAKLNPSYKFDIYGKGNYFENKKTPKNVKVTYRFFKQSEIPNLLQQYDAALMPTRQDTQGVMNCEIAAFGLPLITSDIEICKLMLSESKNTHFYRLGSKLDLSSIKINSSDGFELKNKFSPQKLIQMEVDLFKLMKVNH